MVRLDIPKHERLAATGEFTKEMLEAGYEGIVVYGYESFDEWSVCVFVTDAGTEPCE